MDAEILFTRGRGDFIQTPTRNVCVFKWRDVQLVCPNVFSLLQSHVRSSIGSTHHQPFSEWKTFPFIPLVCVIVLSFDGDNYALFILNISARISIFMLRFNAQIYTSLTKLIKLKTKWKILSIQEKFDEIQFEAEISFLVYWTPTRKHFPRRK